MHPFHLAVTPRSMAVVRYTCIQCALYGVQRTKQKGCCVVANESVFGQIEYVMSSLLPNSCLGSPNDCSTLFLSKGMQGGPILLLVFFLIITAITIFVFVIFTVFVISIFVIFVITII